MQLRSRLHSRHVSVTDGESNLTIKRLLASLALLLALSLAARAQYVTLTGTLQSSNGMPASNYILSFTPSQMGFISGTGVVINAATYCATSVDGSVVGVPNPLGTPVVTPGFTGSLPPANYFTKIIYYDASGNVTLASPERVVQLNSTGQISVAPPVGGLPSGAAGMKVYISTATNLETLQGTSTGSAAYVQSVPLVTGANPPSTNTTICKQIANDVIWPSGTGYTVALTDTGGNTLPGYPMQWQLMGPNTTINLSTGLPYYHGTVYFPTPILASPLNHALQTISGPLGLSGYNLSKVGAIGVGTSLPAWPVDVENGAINASGGFILDGSGGTTGNCVASDGTAYDIGTPCGQFYQTIHEVGTPLTQRAVLNFDGTVVASDSSSPAQTNVGLPAKGTAGTYVSPTSITFDAQGRETAIVAGSVVNRTCNSHGCYLVFPDGTYEEWGVSDGCGTGSNNDCTVIVMLPHTLPTSLDSATSTVWSSYVGPNKGNILTMIYSPSTTSFVVRFGATVQVGGGGDNIDSSVVAYWHVIGH